MNTKAFTLVELIVVITILAILWTIGFISLQWYSKSARDSTRISDITSMEKILNLYKLTNTQYPTPVDPTIVTYSGSTAWTQWVFWKTAYTRNAMMSNVPLDPVTALEYPYSVTADGQEYELAAVLENPIASSITSSAYAGTQEAQIYVKWNYNGKFLRVIKDDTTYLLWVPSIIASDITSVDIENILISKRLVYNGHKNLPASFSWSVYDTNPPDWFDFWWASYVASGMILFAWDMNDLETDQAQRVTLFDNLQASYSWTTISAESGITQLLGIDITSDKEASNYVAIALNNSFHTNISTVAVESSESTPSSCATQPWYSNANFTAGTPTTVDEAWQNTNNANACYYECTGWYTWNDCSGLNPYASCTWVNTPTPFSGTTTYTWCDTADIIVCDWVWSWYTISACNVWTNTASTAYNDAGWYWELFQWWNNAWIRTAWTSHTQISVSNIDSTYTSATFIYDTADWNTTQNDNMWWDTTDTDESRIWPCEVWYHVPTNSEWIWIHTAWWWWSNWPNMSNALKMPMAGIRKWNDADLFVVGYFGYYWSSSPNPGTQAYYISFYTYNLTPSYYNNRAYGFSVRCFKN
jgi:prepilin-type N-terminal cleavage/methylation domain-containing protein